MTEPDDEDDLSPAEVAELWRQWFGLREAKAQIRYLINALVDIGTDRELEACLAAAEEIIRGES